MATATATPEAKADAEADGTKKKGGPLKIIIIALVGILLVGGGSAFGVWWFMVRVPVPKPEPEPEPGEVVVLEPISVNLADGHYLKIGVAMQMILAEGGGGGHGGGEEGTDGSAALDHTIELFSGRTMEELENPEERGMLKEELLTELNHAYHEQVLDVYFTEFVMQ